MGIVAGPEEKSRGSRRTCRSGTILAVNHRPPRGQQSPETRKVPAESHQSLPTVGPVRMPALPSPLFKWILCLVAALMVRLATAAPPAPPPANPDDVGHFETQVRPVLARRCYGCHSGKTAK